MTQRQCGASPSAAYLEAQNFTGLCALLLLALTFTSPVLHSQEGTSELDDTRSEEEPEPEETPENVVQYYKKFLRLYMKNFQRVQELKTLRNAGAGARVTEKRESEIRNSVEDSLNEIQIVMNDLEGDAVSTSQGRSIRKIFSQYQLYIEKILNDWEPTDRQILRRRRMGERELLRSAPDLAPPELLKRSLLGELMSRAETIPEVWNWLQKRVSEVQQWIFTQYIDMNRLFVEQLKRVYQVEDSEEVTNEQIQKTRTSANQEWTNFWQVDSSDRSKWTDMRRRTRKLSSLFRDRTDRLPGNQESLSQRIDLLKKQIAELRGLRIENPFKNEKKQLQTILQLTRSFVDRAERLQNTNGIEGVSGVVASFVRDMQDRDPVVYWKVENRKALNNKKQRVRNQIESVLFSLNQMGYKQHQDTYRFATEAIMQLTRFLTTRYGKQVGGIGEVVRRVVLMVRAQQRLITDGVEFILSYREGLGEMNQSTPKAFIQFEKQFRQAHRSSFQQLHTAAHHLQETRSTFESLVKKIRKIKPAEMAATVFKNAKRQKQRNEAQEMIKPD